MCKYPLCVSLTGKLRDKWIVTCQENKRAENRTQMLILKEEFDAEINLNSNADPQTLASGFFLGPPLSQSLQLMPIFMAPDILQG